MKALTFITRRNAAFFFCCLLMAAFIYSKFLLSVSMIGLILVALLEWDRSMKFPFRINRELPANWKAFLGNKGFAIIPVYFLIVLAGAFYSEDSTYLLERLRIRLPFLLLPFTFFSLPVFSEREYKSLLFWFVVFIFIASLGIGYNYWRDFDEITLMISEGKPIPTPVNHIRFSLALAFCILAGATLFRSGFYIRYPRERYLTAGLTVFLFFFLHLLSVRSGLIALYLCILFYVLRDIYRTRRYATGLLMLLGLVALPFLFYQFVPSFRSKIDYMRWDWQMRKIGLGDQYSDSDRFLSIHVGLEVGHKNPVIGVGAGDVKKEVEKIYREQYPTISEVKMPHNQLVSVYSGSGILGVLLFLTAFFIPLLYRRHYMDPLFVSLHIIMFCSFMTESTIETAVGTAFYSFFLLLSLNYLRNRENDKL